MSEPSLSASSHEPGSPALVPANDARLVYAAEYLTGRRRHAPDPSVLPPSVASREIADLRRQLGIVLDVAERQAVRLDGIAAICETTLTDETADRQYAVEGIALIAGAP